MKILFIGNSYTYCNDLPRLVEKLARENGKNVQVFSVTRGGRMLLQLADPEDDAVAELKALLKAHHFDFCFLQEQSVLPARYYEGFSAGVACALELLGDRVDQVILYATWGRKEGSPVLQELGMSSSEMTAALTAAYRKAASQYGLGISEVGEKFLRARAVDPAVELYAEDFAHPSYAGSCLAAMTHYDAIFHEMPDCADSLVLTQKELEVFRSVLAAR